MFSTLFLGASFRRRTATTLLFVSFLVTALSTECLYGQSEDTREGASPIVQPLTFAALKKALYATPQQLTVAYFWATWCGPCVKKIHLYQALQDKYRDQGLRVVIVSMDEPKEIAKVVQFMARKNLMLESLLYKSTPEINGNTFINGINPTWNGSIPYVMFLREGRIVDAYEGSLSEEALQGYMKTHL